MGIEVRRAGNLSKNLAAMHRRIDSKVERALRRVAEKVLYYGNTEAPKDTHALVASGHVGQVSKFEFFVGYAAKDFDATPFGGNREKRPPFMYVLWVYFGTTDTPANPFLERAIEANKADLVKVLNSELK